MMRLRGFDIRDRLGLIGGVLGVWLAANLVMAFLVNLPRTESVASLKEATDNFRQARIRREHSVQSLRQQYTRVMDGRRTLDTFYRDVLSTKQDRMTAFQGELRDIAVKFHIDPSTITYAKEESKKDQIVKFSATMPLNGSYENLRQFMSAIENSDNFMTISNILLADSKEGGVILGLSITVCTYFFDPELTPKQEPGAGRPARG